MWFFMPLNIVNYLKHIYYSFFKARGTPGRLSSKRLVVVLFVFLVYPLWVVYLQVGYWLDELFFPAYHQQNLESPLFIVGNFRSGTTFLHRLLLQDERFTGIRTWEIYFAPSISYRRFFRFVGRFSRMIGSPIRKLIKRFDQSLNDYSYMHKTGMRQFEEDSHLFYHLWSSYNLFALFPFPELAWQYIYYDQQVPRDQREREFDYFRNLLQRHVYCYGGKTYISKNPDFSPMVETILETFPEARFINIVRDPRRVVPSTINMWANHWHTFGSPRENYPLRDVLLEHIQHWYVYPHQKLRDLPPDRYAVIDFAEFVRDPHQVIERVYDQFQLPLSPAFEQVLIEQTIRSQNYQSSHDYSLEAMGIREESINQDIRPLLDIYQDGQKLPDRTPQTVQG